MAVDVERVCAGPRFPEGPIAPYDIIFDREGGFWFADSGCTTPEGRRHGAIHHARPDGAAIVLGRLRAFEIEAPGVLAPPPSPFSPGRVACTLPGHQMCDSLAVEADGSGELFRARWPRPGHAPNFNR